MSPGLVKIFYFFNFLLKGKKLTYKLFYPVENVNASEGIRVVLEEIGADYELIETTKDRTKPRPKAQIDLNPNGWVPVLALEGGKKGIYECAAITIFLCDRHPEAGLAPRVDEMERGLYLQTLVYFSSSVQNAFQLDYYPDRFADTKTAQRSAQRRGCLRLRETWKIIDDQIGKNKWLLGDNFSAADIYLFMLTTWLRPERGHPSFYEFPNISRIFRMVLNRPSIQLVYQKWIKENIKEV